MYVLIPAYKPDNCLLDIVREIHENTDYSIIVVNDGSGQAYEPVFAALPDYCTLLVHDVNKGKGRAMKTGFTYLCEHGTKGDGVVIVDADGQHLLKDVVRVCEEFTAHPDSMIIGARQFTGKVPFRSRFGNTMTKYVFAAASGVKLSDTQTGLRAIPIDCLAQLLDLKGERYEYEMNMLLHAAEVGIPMREVMIETVYIDDNSSSHFNVIRDSFKIYGVILKFVLSSIMAFLVDYAFFNLFYYLLGGKLEAATQLLIATVAARVISSLVNFFINKKVVFKNKDGAGSTLIKYYLLVLMILGANFGLMHVLVNLLGMNASLAKILVEAVLFIVSYFMQRKFVFKNKGKKVA